MILRYALPRPLRSVQSASALLCGLALSWSLAGEWTGNSWAEAASPETAPADLVSALESIEAAANAGNTEAVMQNYSADFTNDDGFTYDSYAAALETLWGQYSDLDYRVELQSWESTAEGYTAETVTYISGVQMTDGQRAQLESVIRSEQTFVAGKVASQTTLSERNQLTSGETPPTVSVILPEQVESGESYDFDAIVQEPLGNRYLLGAAIEEGTTADDFFTGRPVELELLAAGGLFKIGQAPTSADSRWVSALLVREDGLTVITRRLRVD